MQIFSGLLKLDDNLEPVPDIAASMPTISSDGLTYTFHLRQDVKFQDGTPVTADDFNIHGNVRLIRRLTLRRLQPTLVISLG